jgi:hypothetical protein
LDFRGGLHRELAPGSCSFIYFSVYMARDTEGLQVLAYVWFGLRLSYRCWYPEGLMILGTLEKLRKATMRFVMSVRPHGTTRLPMDGFS